MKELGQVANLDRVASPALLVWPDRVQTNIDRMIELAGDPARLRPHVKTHKMDAVVRMHLASGIERFKAATIAELELCLAAGAREVLLAYPLVGPNRARLVQLATRYPEATVQFLADNAEVVTSMDRRCEEAGIELGVFLDFDCGMQRTGTDSIAESLRLAAAVHESGSLCFSGVHAYDGHVRVASVEERERIWDAAMDSVRRLVKALQESGLRVEAVVGGGSPTFGLHAAKQGWQCSPGTTVFWDGGYGAAFPDLPFESAAAILTRVISKPGNNRLCLDLGHKAIASEGPLENRVRLLGLEGAKPVQHSEEHLVVEVEDASLFELGHCVLGIPHHICPTVALHQEAFLVRGGEATGERWEVTARNRRITV
ncbi:MAG: D-TA family PLP-dependent enzyme [Akkermansiaceae bacterium]